MSPLRIWGDALSPGPPAQLLRAVLRRALAEGWAVALCLSAVREPDTAPEPGTPYLDLSDGARTLRVPAPIGSGELDLIRRAADTVVPATAPVLVFAEGGRLPDAVITAGLEWPVARRVIPVVAGTAPEQLLTLVRAELRRAGTEDPAVCREARDLRPFLALPPPPTGGVIVHPGAVHLDDGTDLVLRVFAQHFAAAGCRLRVVLDAATAGAAEAPNENPAARLTTFVRFASGVLGDGAPPGLRNEVGDLVQVVPGPLGAEHLRDAAAVVMPLRKARGLERIVDVLASGRPLCLSRFAGTADLVPEPGLCEVIGGRHLPAESGLPPRFEPDPRTMVAGLRRILEEPTRAAAMAARARRHALAELTADRPAAAAPHRCEVRSQRPSVVLEAPLFEVSSASELTIETARALLLRGNVDLFLRPRTPFRGDLAGFRARAPELVGHLHRQVEDADLWLSAGWPPRAHRPRARLFAVRFDYEYGALPADLSPLLTQEADRVVVHSTTVRRLLTTAGRSQDTLDLVPHGVDGEVFREDGPLLPEVVAAKGPLPAVLFAGGMVFRKGIDVFLRALLTATATAAGVKFCAVVKAVGSDLHYAGFELGSLVRRFQATPGAPPLLLLQEDLSRPELAALYRSCDLLVHPYRGEGFGLPVLEARACGLPVIITRGGSTDDFCSGPSVAVIPSARRFLELPQVHLSQPWLLEPDGDALAGLVREAVRDLPRLAAAGRAAAPLVRVAYAWDTTAAGIETLAWKAMCRRPGPLPAVPLAAAR